MTEGTTIQIIAVDDDETILDIYETGLTEAGFSVKTFSNPKKAKEYFAALKAGEAPHVILMDIMMPGIDGISLMHDIHSMDATSHVPIIAVSGLSDAATLNDALLFGAMDYLVKPFDLDALKLKINKAFDLAQKRAPKTN
ncbi:MAG: response regulator [Elusimicrobiales bacterium]|jgi:DNA-binding response OmpR family regulator